MGLKIKLWGIRGSLPSPTPPSELQESTTHFLQLFEEREDKTISATQFLKSLRPPWRGGYGGHTTCIEVKSPHFQFIIDGGSGIRSLGERLLLTPLGHGKGEAHIFMTHFHWDHIIGLAFFVPIFIPGNTIHFYSVQDDLEQNIKTIFKKPFFPVAFEQLGAKVIFHKLTPRCPHEFKDVTITPYQLDHPDPCWGFRIESGGKIYSHCVDSEMTRISREDLGPDLPLYQNVDLALFDAQYTFQEVTERIHWGHASAPIGLDLSMRENIKQVLFTHHDPSATDVHIQKLEQQTREYYNTILKHSRSTHRDIHPVDWCFASEGMEISI